uniref:E3 ubiquitin-protein ligase RNF26 n=1 Tax=Periophthalmus magnuspinnatus TaxID=409849 RepID=A0A3B4BBQ5_9GOBI
MGLVNLFFSTAAKCLDAVFLLLDLNFVIVHSLVRTVLAVISFISSIPTLLLYLLLETCNYTSLCLLSIAEATSDIAHGTVTVFGSLPLAVEGLLESLKMVGYLSMHILIRGKDHLCRGLLSLQEGCGIVISLVVYFTNTVVNFVLIAIQNLYLGAVSVLQTVSSPLHKVMELTLTTLTFLYSCLAGTTAFLWEPFKVLLDFFISLVYVFIKIFMLNIYGFMLTVIIAVTTTAYLNPELRRQAWYVNDTVQRLQRIVHHVYVLERRLWQQVSRHSSQLLDLRARRPDRAHRAGGDGIAGQEEERRDPPDGRANENTNQGQSDSAVPSSSTHKAPNKHSKDKDCTPEEDLLKFLKEQEERKKCVICQDSTKTVVLLPCRHLCLCRDCTNILLGQPIYQQNCPLCRHMILNTMDVYL